jgi:hypothetical protein
MTSRQTQSREGLEEVIDAVQDRMLKMPPDSDEFAKTVDGLDKLYKIKSANRDRVSMDAMVAVVGNLAGILLILNFERFHVVSSKALGFVLKTKV